MVTLIYIIASQERLFPDSDERWVLVFRCVTGFTAFACGYSSFRFIPLGDASSISLSSPVIVSIFAWIALKEPCGLVHTFCLIVVLSGVFLISRPSFIFNAQPNQFNSSDQKLGTILAMAGAVFVAMAFTSMRKLKRTSSVAIIFWYSLTMAVLSALIVSFISEFKLPESQYEVLLFIAISVFGLCEQSLLTLAFKIEKAGPVSLSRTLNVLVAFVYQIWLLNEPVYETSIIGSVLIVLGVLLVTLHKWLNEGQQPESRSDDIIHYAKLPNSDPNQPENETLI